jgi:hypothetical protein
MEIALWYGARDARMGLSGSGWEGGTVRPWDEARSARAHGFHCGEDGTVYGTGGGKTGQRHRDDIHRFERIERVVKLLPKETERLLCAAFEMCGATGPLVFRFHGTKAPLVGLGLKMFLEMQPEERRAPIVIVEAWNKALHDCDKAHVELGVKSCRPEVRGKHVETRRATERLLAPVRRRALAVYEECVAVYDEVRTQLAKERRDEQALRTAAIRRGAS